MTKTPELPGLEQPDLLTAHAAAKALGVSIRTMRTYMADGTLERVELQVPKRAVRVRRLQVEQLRQAQRGLPGAVGAVGATG